MRKPTAAAAMIAGVRCSLSWRRQSVITSTRPRSSSTEPASSCRAWTIERRISSGFRVAMRLALPGSGGGRLGLRRHRGLHLRMLDRLADQLRLLDRTLGHRRRAGLEAPQREQAAERSEQEEQAGGDQEAG